VEIDLKENGTVGFMLLFMGTEKGESKTEPGLYYGEMSRKGVTTKLGRPSGLKNIR